MATKEREIIHDPEELKRRLDPLLQDIKANALAIADITIRGDIAMFASRIDSEVEKILKSKGWNGENVWRMSTKLRKTIAATCAEVGDVAGERWLLAKKRKGRIFVFYEMGTLLVNFEPGVGFTIEPGTTDSERLAKLH